AIVATIGLAAAVAPSLAHMRAAHGPIVERYVRDMLRVLPPHAVVLTRQDELYFGAIYARAERPDVVVIAWSLLGLPWYQQRVARAGVLGDPAPAPPAVQLARGVFGDH